MKRKVLIFAIEGTLRRLGWQANHLGQDPPDEEFSSWLVNGAIHCMDCTVGKFAELQEALGVLQGDLSSVEGGSHSLGEMVERLGRLHQNWLQYPPPTVIGGQHESGVLQDLVQLGKRLMAVVHTDHNRIRSVAIQDLATLIDKALELE